MLADEAGRQALPVGLTGGPGWHSLWDLADQQADIVTADAPEEFAARLLHSAGAEVTGVDIVAAGAAALTQETGRARIEVSGLAGRRHVVTGLGLGAGHGGRGECPAPGA